jgi:cell division protein FtsW (lipid II flippase)
MMSRKGQAILTALIGEQSMQEHDMSKMHHNHYRRLIVMAVLSFVAMYVLMYAMVNSFGDVYPNFNQFYMAGLMTAPMVVIEVLLMSMMYPNKKLNVLIVAVSTIVGLVLFTFIRQQVAISNRQ